MLGTPLRPWQAASLPSAAEFELVLACSYTKLQNNNRAELEKLSPLLRSRLADVLRVSDERIVVADMRAHERGALLCMRIDEAPPSGAPGHRRGEISASTAMDVLSSKVADGTIKANVSLCAARSVLSRRGRGVPLLLRASERVERSVRRNKRTGNNDSC